MNRLRNLGIAVNLMAAIGLFTWAVGCHKPPANQSAATNASSASPTVAKTSEPAKDRVLVAREKLSDEDRKLVDAQEWCVVGDGRLGSMGVPIKLTIKDQPVFICCDHCKDDALAKPDLTLTKLDELKKKKLAQAASK